MKTIWKYKLKTINHQEIEVPTNTKVLSVKEQFGNIVLYVLVDTEVKKNEIIDVCVIGTGFEVNKDIVENYTFLDTVKLLDGYLMFHVFYKKK